MRPNNRRIHGVPHHPELAYYPGQRVFVEYEGAGTVTKDDGPYGVQVRIDRDGVVVQAARPQTRPL